MHISRAHWMFVFVVGRGTFFVWLPFVGCWENSKFGPCLNRNPRRHSQGIPRKNGFDRVGNECVRENAPSDVKTRTVLLLCDVETSTLALGRAATLYAKAYACALIADYYFETLLMWHGNFWFCLNTRFQLSKYVYCGPKKHGATLTDAYPSYVLICRQIL